MSFFLETGIGKIRKIPKLLEIYSEEHKAILFDILSEQCLRIRYALKIYYKNVHFTLIPIVVKIFKLLKV